MMPIERTAVGTVDKEALAKLSCEFDTRRLSNASQALNEIRLQVDDIESWQKSLDKLHRMATYLLNDNHEFAPPSGQPIWELACELSEEIFDWKEKLDEICDVLDELSGLAPEEINNEEDDEY